MTSRPGQRIHESRAWRACAVCAAALLGSVALSATGCDRKSGADESAKLQRGTATVGGTVVSTVDGEPITLAQVEALVREAKLEPREALQRLQAERLLMREADRRGVSSHAIESGTRRALGQAFLDAQAAAITVSDSELRDAYANDSRFRAPERRKSLHVLAKAKKSAKPEVDAAARAIAARAVAEFQREDAIAVHQRYRQIREAGVDVKSEEIPPAGRDAPLVDEYLDALYSIPGAGVVPQPVRTQFGWHAIRVTEVLPPFETPFKEAAPALREEMLLRRREEQVKELLAQLRSKYEVTLEQDVSARLAALSE